MMKILYITPNPNDPLAFYRGSLPLARLRQQYDGVDYIQANQLNWSTIINCDFVFFQRPYTQEHMRAVKLCQQWGVPFTVDFDDWLYELMPDNPAFHTYNSNKDFYHYAAEHAKLVIVATQDMADFYMNDYGIKCEVVPNAYDTDMLTPRQNDDHSMIVLWRGSSSHVNDLISVRHGWLELIKKHKTWQFVFMNVPPWWLGDNDFKNVKTLQPHGVREYMDVIQQIKPAIMTHPLVDCRFNRAKSMCSWIESCHAAAAFVGPDFKEYNRDGVTTYKPQDNESFYNAIDGLIENPVKIPENVEKGQSLITGELSLRKVNEKRFKLFSSLGR